MGVGHVLPRGVCLPCFPRLSREYFIRWTGFPPNSLLCLRETHGKVYEQVCEVGFHPSSESLALRVMTSHLRADVHVTRSLR